MTNRGGKREGAGRKPKPGSEVIGVRLSKENAELLRSLAARDGVSISDVMRAGLIEYAALTSEASDEDDEACHASLMERHDRETVAAFDAVTGKRDFG